MPSEDTKFVALHEHYNGTFSNIKESIKLRDKLLALVLFILVFIVLYSFWPNDAVNTLTQIITQKTGVTLNFSDSFLGSMLWFSLLIVIVRYTQTVVYIERQYSYIHKLEEDLHKNYKNSVAFTREGKSYLEKYPIYSDWVCLLYTKIFPAVLLLIVLIKIVSEWALINKANLLSLLLNTSIVIFILLSIVLYMVFIHKQK